jgi:Enoyl-CoA hydratase/isomerase
VHSRLIRSGVGADGRAAVRPYRIDAWAPFLTAVQEEPMSQAEFPTFQTILYDEPRPGVARVTLNRPEKRNAQNMQMTYSAFDHAVRQPHVKVIVLAAVGQHFSSGHDLSGDGSKTWKDFPVLGTWANFDQPGAEGALCPRDGNLS